MLGGSRRALAPIPGGAHRRFRLGSTPERGAGGVGIVCGIVDAWWPPLPTEVVGRLYVAGL
jgi:hypothetical protein